ncbi:MAG: ABC transporter permease [Bacteroidota bacterium]|nr:ABC transporter permease [Bacteroidota bacterium]
MFQHYLKIAWRNLRKYKTQTVVSVLGLAIGFTAFAFTLSWIRYEMGYDKHIPDADRVYKILRVNKRIEGGFNFLLPDAFKMYLESFPEIEAVTAISTTRGEFKRNDELFMENGHVMFADTSFFKVFYPDVQIDYPAEIFKEPPSLIFSTQAAKKIGLSPSDIGRYNSRLDAIVLGIAPGTVNKQTNVPFDVMTVRPVELDPDCSWCYSSRRMYARVHKNVNIEALAAKLDSVYFEEALQGVMSYKLVPLREVRYKHPEDKAKIKHGHLRIFVVVSLLVILSALFNYLMLFVNKIKIRNRELALRKVNGASNRKLVILLLIEMGLILLFSLLISGVLSELLYAPFVKLSEIEATKSFLIKGTVLYGIGIFILSILVASIPIYVFMKRSVANTLHPDAKTFAGVKNGFALTSLFLQLTVGTLLIFCSLVFLYQFNKLNEKDIGFNRFNIMSFRCDVYLTKDELRKIPGVEEVIFFQYQFLPRGGTSHFRYKTESGEVIETESFQIHEPDFIEFFDMKILEGRNFHYGETNACLINETAKRKFGLTDPIGERVNNLTVIGVVADMYIDSPLLPVYPSAYKLRQAWPTFNRNRKTGEWENISVPVPESPKASASSGFNLFAYKYSPGSRELVQQRIRELITKSGGSIIPFNDLDFRDMEVIYAEYTLSERYLLTLLGIMTGVAILIAVFGIYSMITLACNQRRKEMAIRKVNGAKAKEILALFFRQYFAVTVAACVVAFPVGVHVMQRWLEQYTRRVSMEWWLFAGVFALVVAIVFISMAFRVWKAASENPAEVVKAE